MASFWSDRSQKAPPPLPRGGVEAYLLDGNYTATHTPAGSTPTAFRSAGIRSRKILSEDFALEAMALLHDPKVYGGEPRRCFIPRHGFRFYSNSAEVDVLICLQCYLVYFFSGFEQGDATLSEGGRSSLDRLFSHIFPPH
jgi:hypothetical protein